MTRVIGTIPTHLLVTAENHGITITTHTGYEKGYWVPDRNLISIRSDLNDLEARCTFAHELAHALLGHPGCTTAKDELKAHRRAAQMLISPADYAAAEETYEGNPIAIAADLQVTQYLLAVWQQWWQTSGQFTTAA